MLKTIVAVVAVAAASNALADDAQNGKRLAESHCSPCHAVAPHLRNEVADAPPFEVIGRKYGGNAGAVMQAIVGPHPRMNFSPQRSEAADIAAYIVTLVK